MLISKTTHDLIEIVSAGGGLDFVARSKPTRDLIDIAVAAGFTKVPVTFRGMSSRTTRDIIDIVAAGKGMVIVAD